MKSPMQIMADYKRSDTVHKNRLKACITIPCSMATAVFKFVFGILVHSFVWAYSGLYALGSSVAKFLFFRSTHAKYGERQKANFCIAIAVILFFSAVIFDMCTMIKQFEEETVTKYPLAVVIVASIYFFAAYVATIIGIIANRKNKELNVFAYKIIGVSGALMNLVLLQRMILSCLHLPIALFKQVNSSFGYMIGATMALTAVVLFVRCLLCRKHCPKSNLPREGEEISGE